MGLQRVTRGYRGRAYSGLQMVTGGYTGLQRVTGGYKDEPVILVKTFMNIS